MHSIPQQNTTERSSKMSRKNPTPAEQTHRAFIEAIGLGRAMATRQAVVGSKELGEQILLITERFNKLLCASSDAYNNLPEGEAKERMLEILTLCTDD
jgi:hypothetical protein